MDMRKMVGGEHLKASDCDPSLVGYITDVTEKVFDNNGKKEPKGVVHFKGEKKTLVLNNINAEAIMNVLGYNTANWVGHKVVMFKTTTEFAGKIVDCIRIKEVVKRPETVEQTPAEEPIFDEDDSDIPF